MTYKLDPFYTLTDEQRKQRAEHDRRLKEKRVILKKIFDDLGGEDFELKILADHPTEENEHDRCPRCGSSDVYERYVFSFCPKCNELSKKTKQMFCEYDGERLLHERDHDISIHFHGLPTPGYYVSLRIRYVWTCKDCGISWDWTYRTSGIEELKALAEKHGLVDWHIKYDDPRRIPKQYRKKRRKE